jgi:hypothetical protein
VALCPRMRSFVRGNYGLRVSYRINRFDRSFSLLVLRPALAGEVLEPEWKRQEASAAAQQPEVFAAEPKQEKS